jgi:hypothetical protein
MSISWTNKYCTIFFWVKLCNEDGTEPDLKWNQLQILCENDQNLKF